MHAAVHLVRRGLEVHQHAEYQLPTWGIVVLVVTTVLFLAMNVSIEYTFGRLIPTLVMVETPQVILLESAHSKAPLLDEKNPSSDNDAPIPEPDLLLVKQTPITRTFSSTIRHLRARAGRLARYRGFPAFAAYVFASSTIANFISTVGFIPHVFAPIMAALVCANLSTTWTHIAISNPSEKHWIRRIPSCKTWKKVAGPTFFMAVAKQLTCMVPMSLAGWWGMLDMMPHQINALSQEERSMLVWKGLCVGLVGLTMAILFLLPAKVTLTRVQASLLSEEEETIVPFDKSFSGKVISESEGGNGAVRARDAWRSFSHDSRLTLFKSYGKVMAMETFLVLGFAMTIVGELVFIMGDDLKQFIPSDSTGQIMFGGQ